MNKRGNANVYTFVTIIVIVIISAILSSFFIFPSLQPGDEIETILLSPNLADIPIPTDCSNASIRAVWDSIFKESSANIEKIVVKDESTGGCDQYFAVRTNGNNFKMLSGEDDSNDVSNDNFSSTSVFAFNGEFNSSSMSELQSFIDNSSSVSDFLLIYFLVVFGYNANGIFENRSQPISSIADASSYYDQIFKPIPGEWHTEEDIDVTYYGFKIYESLDEIEEELGFVQNSQIVYDLLIYEKYINQQCSPDWIQTNSTCSSDDKITTSYYDSNACNQGGGVFLSPFPPTNKSYACDYNDLGIIGSQENIKAKNFNPKILINSDPIDHNISYNGSKDIEIQDGSTTKIVFEMNFSKQDLNLHDLSIQKQPSTSNFGYVIINGISSEKTIHLDRISGSTDFVCVKEARVDTINEVSESCTGDNEFLIPCPASGDFTCSISDDIITISGVRHSAVKEVLSSESACLEDWTCGSWSVCSSSKQTRSCQDNNNCGTNITKPRETQSCTCIPLWQCDPWAPSECPKNETQSRECFDSNSCATNDQKPTLTRSCEYQSDSIFLYIMALVILVIIIAIIIIIFIQMKSKKNYSLQSSGITVASRPKTPPPSQQPQQNQRQQSQQRQQNQQQQRQRPRQLPLNQQTKTQNPNNRSQQQSPSQNPNFRQS
jgi:hypothetical protein